jgi:hypothetical protein
MLCSYIHALCRKFISQVVGYLKIRAVYASTEVFYRKNRNRSCFGGGNTIQKTSQQEKEYDQCAARTYFPAFVTGKYHNNYNMFILA